MTTEFYTTNTFYADHSTFGGIIYPSDFITDYQSKDKSKGSTIARRILSDWRFDEQCKKNAENRILMGNCETHNF